MAMQRLTSPCILLSLALLTNNSAHSQTRNPEAPNGIVVSGECLTKVTQDRGSVVIGSTFVAKSTKEASERVIRTHEALKARVIGLGLKNFISETAEYSVNQECSYDQGKRHCEGYRARLATRFETSEIARIGDIIAASSELGSEEVSDLTTFAAPETVKSAREACLEIAMKNAASKAQTLARGAGVALGKLKLIQESALPQGDRPIPMARRGLEVAAMSADIASAGPSIDAKPLDLKVEITAQYAID